MPLISVLMDLLHKGNLRKDNGNLVKLISAYLFVIWCSLPYRRSKEEEEKARKAYAVDVFEGLEELLDYKRRMTAIEYVQKRDFRVS